MRRSIMLREDDRRDVIESHKAANVPAERRLTVGGAMRPRRHVVGTLKSLIRTCSKLNIYVI